MLNFLPIYPLLNFLPIYFYKFTFYCQYISLFYYSCLLPSLPHPLPFDTKFEGLFPLLNFLPIYFYIRHLPSPHLTSPPHPTHMDYKGVCQVDVEIVVHPTGLKWTNVFNFLFFVSIYQISISIYGLRR